MRGYLESIWTTIMSTDFFRKLWRESLFSFDKNDSSLAIRQSAFVVQWMRVVEVAAEGHLDLTPT